MTGKLHLIGVGPGDPELLTLKAVRLLNEVAVIAFPHKDGEPSQALEIARAHIGTQAKLLPANIPMSTDRAPARDAYDRIAMDIMHELKTSGDVAYLCEGDPLFYGSAMYLIDRVSHLADVEIVPGVTSMTATAAAACRPLAARNEVLKVLPATLPDRRLREELKTAECAVIIKVGRHFERIRALLAECGQLDNAVIVEHATTKKQRVTPLRHYVLDSRSYFSTILCYAGSEGWAHTGTED
jgi:precorrin-2/cobalt-factor-2 C20-methyltransferase